MSMYVVPLSTSVNARVVYVWARSAVDAKRIAKEQSR
jgi:hypothetical protein